MTRRRVLIVLAVAAFAFAGMASYFSDPNPDGLEAATERGCTAVQVDGAGALTGECPATDITDHALATTPLADYAVAGRDEWTGVAGIVGVAVTLVFAFVLFRVLARSRATATDTTPPPRGSGL